MDFELENEFDNFLTWKKRKPSRRGRNISIKDKVRERQHNVSKERMSNIASSLTKMKGKKRVEHKKVLRTLKSPQFLANRHNHPSVYKQVKRMAIDIDKLTGQLIKEKSKKQCNCGGRGKRNGKQYKNFSGGSTTTEIWNKYKMPLLIGGALIFFLYSPIGKKIINSQA
jgi:hypothetical protein